MKSTSFKKIFSTFLVLLSVMFVINCSSNDESGGAGQPAATITTSATSFSFGEVSVLDHSIAQLLQIGGSNLVSNVTLSVTDNFELSIDNAAFSSQVSLDANLVNSGQQDVYVRFSPTENAIGAINGSLSIQSESVTTQTIGLVGVGLSITPIITVDATTIVFEDTMMSTQSDATTLVVNGDNLLSVINLSVTEGFQISLDNITYTNTLQIPSATANDDTSVYVQFVPTTASEATGVLTLVNDDAELVEVSLSGNGLAIAHNYIAFNSERLAFGGGYNQSATQTFNLHDDLSNIETIKMYVKLTCPTGGCDEWDVYANVKVTDPASGELYELGRYITPYWNDNSQLDRGFEFDVTDFKSLLSGSTELRIRTECWNAKGYEVTVDFDYIEGTPDYQYYAVSRVIAYDDWSSSGVPYGVDHSFDLDKSVTIPANAESTHLRSIISGWGHATPNDADGRPCAEWCYRTHDVKINGVAMFQHDLAPLGCASNPVNDQEPGNWQSDRAGWCPGMVVPVRIDQFDTTMAGSAFAFEYDYEDWVSDGVGGNAFYATSTLVVVKSNTPISKPTVNE
nr:peptide-N-glycosidase F-related protein [uncultured Psychroserpens sp.]